MPCYDRISGSLKEVKTIYDRIGGALKEVKTGYDRISGALKVYHESYETISLHDVPVGKTVAYNGKNYTVIAKDYSVSGDVILWEVTATSTGNHPTSNPSTSTTPFGTGNTNKVSITYERHSGTKQLTVTNYGWLLSYDMVYKSSLTGTNKEFMDYFSTTANRKRSTNCWLGCTSTQETDYDDEGNYDTYTAYHYINTSGTATYTSRNAPSGGYGRYYAYSVKGTLTCRVNSNGSYELMI